MKKRKPNQPKVFLPVKIDWKFTLGLPITESDEAARTVKEWIAGLTSASPLPIIETEEVMLQINPQARAVAVSEDALAELVLLHQQNGKLKKVKPQPKKRHRKQVRCVVENCGHAQGRHTARNANAKRPCMVNDCKCKSFLK